MTKYYWWIVSRDPDNGKPYLIFGSDKSEEEARIKGLEMLGGLNFTIKRFPTRTLSTASAMLRGTILNKSHNLRESARRQGHEKTIKRDRQRYQSRQQVIW